MIWRVYCILIIDFRFPSNEITKRCLLKVLALHSRHLVELKRFLLFFMWRHFHTQRIIQIFLMDWVQIHHKMKEELCDWKFLRI